VGQHLLSLFSLDRTTVGARYAVPFLLVNSGKEESHHEYADRKRTVL
jgi:hypothetical protein